MRKLLRGLLDIYNWRRRIGVLDHARLLCAEYLWKKGRTGSVTLKGLRYPVFFRARTSDCILVRNILLMEEYPAFANYKPKLIIDAGANIGLATVFFKKYYPDAMVVAIEPDEANCAMFERNTRGYDNVYLLRGGLWSENGYSLRIRNPAADAYSYQMEASDKGVQAYTIQDICTRFKSTHIDILKIDIEGGERELFTNNNGWLNITDNLFIELHDHYAPGASKALLHAVGEKGFHLRIRGENLILTKEPMTFL